MDGERGGSRRVGGRGGGDRGEGGGGVERAIRIYPACRLRRLGRG